MHKDIVRRASDIQECLVSFLSLQRGVFLQCARAKPILDDLTVFTEFGSALEMNQDIPPTHPNFHPQGQDWGVYNRVVPHISHSMTKVGRLE